MAILAIFHGVGFTKEIYESLRPTVKWEHNHPTGALLHSAAFDEQGDLHVADLWDSEDHLKAFIGERLGPGLQPFNLPPPNLTVYPAHNINAFPGLSRYST